MFQPPYLVSLSACCRASSTLVACWPMPCLSTRPSRAFAPRWPPKSAAQSCGRGVLCSSPLPCTLSSPRWPPSWALPASPTTAQPTQCWMPWQRSGRHRWQLLARFASFCICLLLTAGRIGNLLSKAALYCGLQGVSGLSIQWGAWAEGGMASANAATARAIERLGMGMVTPAQGIGAMQSLLLQRAGSMPAVAAAVPFKWVKFMGRLSAVPPMFSQFESYWSGAPAAPAVPPAQGIDTSAAQVPKASPAIAPVGRRAGRRSAAGAAGAAAVPAVPAAPRAATPISAVQLDYVLSQVQQAVLTVLGSSIGPDDPLMAAGLDSLGSGMIYNEGLCGGGYALFYLSWKGRGGFCFNCIFFSPAWRRAV